MATNRVFHPGGTEFESPKVEQTLRMLVPCFLICLNIGKLSERKDVRLKYSQSAKFTKKFSK